MKKPVGCLFFSLCCISALFAQKDYFWVGGSGSWGDLEHWATESGGSLKYKEVPSQNDNVYFDEYSFSSEATVTIPSVIDVGANCRDMNWEMIDEQVSFQFTVVNVNGDLTLSKNLTIDKLGIFSMVSDDEISLTFHHVKSANNSFYLAFNGGGSYIFNDTPGPISGMVIEGGSSVKLNGHDLLVRSLTLNDQGAFHMNHSAVQVESLSATFEEFHLENEGGEILITYQFENETVTELPFFWGRVTFSEHSSYRSERGNDAYFSILTIPVGTSFTIQQGVTLFFDKLVAVGDASEMVAVSSTERDKHVTLYEEEGVWQVAFRQLQSIHAEERLDSFSKAFSFTKSGNP